MKKLKEPDILILDEATSNLDTVTEKMVSQLLQKYSANLTTIIIAHRLSTVRNCDTIFVMESGKILEHGSHEELVNQKGKYFQLIQNQV